MRISLATSLKSRDGGVSRDAKMVNGIAEVMGEDDNGRKLRLRKRPGCSDLGLVKAGTAQLLYSWAGIRAIIGDYLNTFTLTTVTTATQTNLSPTNAGLRWDAQETGSDASPELLMIKNAKQAKTVTRAGVVSAVTYASAMGESVNAVISITRVGTVATVVTAEDTGLDVGDSVIIAGSGGALYDGTKTVTTVASLPSLPITITRSGTTATATSAAPHGLTNGTYAVSGADQSAYNGAQTITVTGANTFTFTVAVTTAPASPATGSFSAPAQTYSGNYGNTLGSDRTQFIGNLTDGYGHPAPVGVGTSFTLATPGGLNGTFVVATVVGIVGAYRQITFTAPGIAVFMSAGVASYSVTPPTVTSITRASTTATVNFSGTTNFVTGNPLTISGANETEYNGTFILTGTPTATSATYTVPTNAAPATPATGSIVITTGFQFTFTIGGSPATPATGTITATVEGGTVPGLPYLNGYHFVMDVNGVIWNDDLDDPTTWGALNSLIAQSVNGKGKALSRSLNYIVAFKEWSTEPFYDRQDGAVGSPLKQVDTALSLVGCASGESVAEGDGILAWLSQVKQQGRSVHIMQGTSIQKVSTPDVDRILNADPLSLVYSYWLKLDGHSLYLLTLVGSNLTIVYDATSQLWMQWSSLTAGSTIVIESIVQEGNRFIVQTATAHGMSDGDPTTIAGASQTAFNDTFQIQYIGARAFAIEVEDAPVTQASGTMTATPYTESYFKFTKYTDYSGVNLLLHESDGHLYQIQSGLFQDAGKPISVFGRTPRLDGGTTGRKKMPVLRLVGDTAETIAMVRFSDDDCQTYSAYQPIDLSDEEPEMRKCGGFKRRTVEVRHVENTALQLDAIEVEITQ